VPRLAAATFANFFAFKSCSWPEKLFYLSRAIFLGCFSCFFSLQLSDENLIPLSKRLVQDEERRAPKFEEFTLSTFQPLNLEYFLALSHHLSHLLLCR
jgi:hypothetical protein